MFWKPVPETTRKRESFSSAQNCGRAQDREPCCGYLLVYLQGPWTGKIIYRGPLPWNGILSSISSRPRTEGKSIGLSFPVAVPLSLSSCPPESLDAHHRPQFRCNFYTYLRKAQADLNPAKPSHSMELEYIGIAHVEYTKLWQALAMWFWVTRVTRSAGY
jgi:hypothetical protein